MTLSIDDINKLQQENEHLINMLEMETKQYNALQKKYDEVLKLAKENADSTHYCLNELELVLEEVVGKCTIMKSCKDDKVAVFAESILEIINRGK